MDYKELALELMKEMYLLKQARPHKQINDSMQGEHFVLQYLAHSSGSVLPSEISIKMGISSARIAATLNSLERKGLITRRIDVSDRRRILVDLTAEGQALAERHHQTGIKMLTEILTMLGEHDAVEYVRITGRLAEFAARHRKTE